MGFEVHVGFGVWFVSQFILIICFSWLDLVESRAQFVLLETKTSNPKAAKAQSARVTVKILFAFVFASAPPFLFKDNSLRS